MLGLVVGLATILLGLPVFLLWAYRHLPSSGWTLPLVLYAAVVAGLLGGAFAVRRSDRLPGLFPGMCAGVAGGLVVIGAVYLAA